MEKILIIEDNNEINALLCEMLSKEGYQIVPAFSGTEGMLHFKTDSFNLVLLDLMLPGINGEEVLAKIRETSDIPIIIISAKSEMGQKVELLVNGADDYIVKPFDVREVLARIRLQLKKNQKKEAMEQVIVSRELTIDDNAKCVRIRNTDIGLTRLEYNIIWLLFSNPNKVFTKQELFEKAWDEYYVGEDKTINVHISNIRNKIRKYSEENYIETVWGIGFKAKGIKG